MSLAETLCRYIVRRMGKTTSGTDHRFSSVFDHFGVSAFGSCSQRVDKNVYFSVLFSRERSFRLKRFAF
jgi:hypothetical protein